MIRRHDRYIFRAFWSTLLAVLLFFTVVVIVLDLSERVSKLTRIWPRLAGEHSNPLVLIAEFYATLLPFMWMRLVPFCVPAASAACLSRLIRHNELTPLLTGGVSIRRIVWPIVVSGVVIVLLMFVVQELLVPTLSRRHMQLWRTLSRNEPNRVSRVPHFHDPGGGRLSMEAYRPFERRMDAVMITFWDAYGAPTEHFWYWELAWNEKDEVWYAPRGGQRIPANPLAPGQRRLAIPKGAVAPLVGSAGLLEVALTAKRSPGLSMGQAAALANANPEHPHYVVLMHQMFTLPLATLVLLLLALPFSFRVAQRTKSAVPSMLGAMGVAALFFGAHFMSGSLARAGDWNPVVLAWLPTVVFGSLGAALYLTLDG